MSALYGVTPDQAHDIRRDARNDAWKDSRAEWIARRVDEMCHDRERVARALSDALGWADSTDARAAARRKAAGDLAAAWCYGCQAAWWEACDEAIRARFADMASDEYDEAEAA